MNAAKNIWKIAVVAALAVLPLFWSNPYYIHLLEVIGIYSILLIGLDIVVGYVGEVSLGHAALFGVGAYTAGVLIWKLHSPFGVNVLAAIVVTALFGLVLALTSLRVRGPYLAMVTLAFGTIVPILINEMTFLTNGPQGIALHKPVFFGHATQALRDRDYYYVVLIGLLLTIGVANRILKSHIGRAFEALRDSPVASDCMAVSVYKYKMVAFVISAAMAGFAGSLFTYSELYISPDTYNFELTILFLLAVTMGGRKTRFGPILGAIIIVMLPNLLGDIDLFQDIMIGVTAVTAVYSVLALIKKWRPPVQLIIPAGFSVGLLVMGYTIDDINDYRLTIFGIMILFVVYYLPDGIMGFLRSLAQKVAPQWIQTHAVVLESGDQSHVWGQQAGTDRQGLLLECRNVIMQFGGLKALDGVNLQVMQGTVHGLIGPNGSGKSTTMNVLTGIYQPTGGSVLFQSRDIAGLAPAAIAAAGIARTFQNVQLFGEMTAIENVLVGLHHTYQSGITHTILSTPVLKREEQEARTRAASLLDFVGLDKLANEEARNLPYGKQRLLEIARALALDPQLLLLDEPAAGLTAPDIKELLAIIQKIRDHGITVILIEHHMDVVMSVCDTVTVLDFGHVIAEGKPAEVQANTKVIEAYLGSSGSQDQGAGALAPVGQVEEKPAC